ncbi:hypothetical protein AQUCO_00100801v1 [Aquilegia coerulea]|uniref:Uncharacterized protein n=1 Tax=Aquilegia coerulea TaxID=218851 RepID=A0A2G5FC14_AQUCA|nr:hypothetical protein AQUCO_00100801v1 [Aquilegia coerulea]
MEGADRLVEDMDNQLVGNIEEMLQIVPPLYPESCIYRIPERLLCINEESYMPRIISVGPFHNGKPKLLSMEAHKQRYLIDFLQRRPDVSLKEYVKQLRELEQRARHYYEDQTICFDSNDFVKLMLLDGCFIIELFLKFADTQSRNKDDPIFKTSWIVDDLLRDMLLLENQIPFFVLEHLVSRINVYKEHNTVSSLLDYTHGFFLHFVRMGQDTILRNPSYQVRHFVDLILQCYVPSEERLSPKRNEELEFIPSATELHDAGVKFKKGQGKCFLDVKFSNGVLEIPTLRVQDRTESLFRNLIAMEQCHGGSHNPIPTTYISDYAVLMDRLINSPNDVALLHSYGIIDNLKGNNEDALQLFNNLGKGTSIYREKFYYYRLTEDVNSYYNSRWHVWKAKLKRDYFNTPWAALSVIAAVLLLICTFIQTLCSLFLWNIDLG